MAKVKRTTHRSVTGKKLYAVRDAKGRFKDIQRGLCCAGWVSRRPRLCGSQAMRGSQGDVRPTRVGPLACD